jgi:hypothetical protein
VQLIGQHDDILTLVKQRILNWFGHVCRAECTLSNGILHGLVKGRRDRGMPMKSWMTNVEEWTGLGAVEATRNRRGRETGGGRWCQKQCAADLPRGYGTHDDDDDDDVLLREDDDTQINPTLK